MKVPHRITMALYAASEACLLHLAQRRTLGRMKLYLAVNDLLKQCAGAR